MNLQKATPEERRIYYREEWSARELPEFIRSSIAQREFGFDHEGSGPSDRYNAFRSVENLEKYMRQNAPFAAYSSISFYEKPQEREGWLGAELVFDIDAKDLPLRRCRCAAGSVCEVCLEDAKQLALLITETLRDDLALREIHHVYSGRGYHIRIFDEDIIKTGSTERAYVLDYLGGYKMDGELKAAELTKARGTGAAKKCKICGTITSLDKEVCEHCGASEFEASRIFTTDKGRRQEGRGALALDKRLSLTHGYPSVFRKRLLLIFQYAREEGKLKSVLNLSDAKIKELFSKRRIIANEIEERKFDALKSILKSDFAAFVESVSRANAEMLDGKVTVDVKRILRLPSSLHSGVSMKCMEVKNLENFDPLREAVPRFVRERKR